jgi:putative glutamine amidotransferase
MSEGLIRVNSFHHQAVRQPGAGLRVCAKTQDGLIEAVEAEQGFALGVQWHPERSFSTDRYAKEVFALFARACNG